MVHFVADDLSLWLATRLVLTAVGVIRKEVKRRGRE